MEQQEKVRGALQETALRMRYVMLVMGTVPLAFLALEVVLLSLFCLWRFNLGIETFLDKAAMDLSAPDK